MELLPDSDLHIKDYLNTVRKRQWTVLAVFVIVATIGTIRTFRATPIYQATAKIVIEKENPNILSFDEIMELDAAKSDYYQTQYGILKSRSLAAKVIDKLGWSPGGVEPSVSEEEIARTMHIDAFLKRIAIVPVSKTRLVDIKASSPDPKEAALTANTLAEIYIDQNVGQKMSAIQKAGQWLAEQQAEASRKLKESEKALQAYKEEHKIVSLEEKQNFSLQKLEELNSEQTRARTERIAAETRYNQLKKLARNRRGGVGADAMPAIIRDPIVMNLRSEYLKLQQDLEDLGKKYTPKHPQIIRLQSQIDAMPGRIASEVDRVVKGVGKEYEMALQRERRIEEEIEQQKGQAQGMSAKAIEYGALKREVDNNRRIFETLLARGKETGIAGTLRTNNIRLVDRAEVPLKPVSPKKRRDVAMALILGLFGGIGLAFFLEYLDDNVHDPDDLKKAVDAPFLGPIPLLDEKGKKASNIDLLALKDPSSVIAEAYRGVRTSILFSSPDKPPRTLVLTSPGPQEGKTVTAVNLALTMAGSGKNILLVDADLRKPRVHKIFKIKNTMGLSSLLSGENEMGKVMNKTPHPNLTVIPSGPIPPNPSELLGSERMGKILALLADRYDRVILDCTPLIAVTDATVLGSKADGVILMVKSGATSRKILQRGKEQLDSVNARIVGVVLNQVDARKSTYYYSSYYYAKYYGEDNGNRKKGRKKAGKKQAARG